MTDIEKLKVVAFDVIRHEVRDFERTTTDSEVGHYVRGVLDLFCVLMGEIQNNNTVGR